MREHLYLCALSDAQRREYVGGTELNLHGAKKNVTLNLERIRRRLVGKEPERLTDFLDIASYVFAADRTASRGSVLFKNMGEEWRRPMRLVIGVRDPAFWSSKEVRAALSDALEFLSEDAWAFDFVALAYRMPWQMYFNLVESDANEKEAPSIVLFSGGLDSLAGAVHELRTTNRRVVLVSHRNTNLMGKIQRELATELATAHQRRVSHVCADHHLSGLLDNEPTQRTRSLFFTAIAAVATYLEKSDRIRFYENGIMSINLPISGQVVGTKASRSTHPRSLQLLERLVGVVTKPGATVDNPFLWMTKAEVVGELQGPHIRPIIARSISCSRSREMDPMHPHCGMCAQCLQRRIGTLGGGAADVDPQEAYRADFLLDARDKPEDRAMAVDTVRSAIEFTRLSEVGFLSSYAGELSRVTRTYPGDQVDDVARQFIDLFRRHGKVVAEIITKAVKDNARSIADGSIDPQSLLRLVIDRPDIAPCPQPHRPTAPSLEPAAEKETITTDSNPLIVSDPTAVEIVIALDPADECVWIEDIGKFAGGSIYPILELFVAMFREDRSQELHPKNYRCILAKQIADKRAKPSEGAITAAIKRARDQLRDDFLKLHNVDIDENVFIENRSKKGYRLNPSIRLVSPDQIRRKR